MLQDARIEDTPCGTQPPVATAAAVKDPRDQVDSKPNDGGTGAYDGQDRRPLHAAGKGRPEGKGKGKDGKGTEPQGNNDGSTGAYDGQD